MGKRVLIIDHDVERLEAIKQLLSARGYDVITARNGSLGLDAFRACAPDIVLTEILMPEMDGIEVLLEIKRANSRAKVIAMTDGAGKLNGEYILNMAGRLGADGALSKPFVGNQLLEAIETVLSEENLRPQEEPGN
jgi:CheY-like chemotaxis protein